MLRQRTYRPLIRQRTANCSFRLNAPRSLGRRGLSVVAAAAQVKVSFSVKCETEWGTSLVLIGADDSLGAWDLPKAVNLTWGEGHNWHADIDLPAGSTQEYKFVKKSKKACEWQDGFNHTIALPADATAAKVQDSWDRSGHSFIVTEKADSAPTPSPIPPSPSPSAPPATHPEAATASAEAPSPLSAPSTDVKPVPDIGAPAGTPTPVEVYNPAVDPNADIAAKFSANAAPQVAAKPSSAGDASAGATNTGQPKPSLSGASSKPGTKGFGAKPPAPTPPPSSRPGRSASSEYAALVSRLSNKYNAGGDSSIPGGSDVDPQLANNILPQSGFTSTTPPASEDGSNGNGAVGRGRVGWGGRNGAVGQDPSANGNDSAGKKSVEGLPYESYDDSEQQSSMQILEVTMDGGRTSGDDMVYMYAEEETRSAAAAALKQLSMVALKTHLKSLGLSRQGSRTQLVQRLEHALETSPQAQVAEIASAIFGDPRSNKLSDNEMRTELKRRGLPCIGNRREMIERLRGAHAL